jgi:hypothetical protein
MEIEPKCTTYVALDRTQIQIMQIIATVLMVIQFINVWRGFIRVLWHMVVVRARSRARLLETSDEEDDKTFRRE